MKTEAIVGIVVGAITVVGAVWTASARLTEYETRVQILEADQFYQGRLSAFKTNLVEHARVFPQVAFPVPVGTILPFYGNGDQIPDGFLLCNGQVITNSHYTTLTAHLRKANYNHSTVQGSDQVTRLPDLQGMFLRGLNGIRTNEFSDPDGNDRFIGHEQKFSTSADGLKATIRANTLIHPHGGQGLINREEEYNIGTNAGKITEDTDKIILLTGGKETRPNNVAVNYIIKY